MAKFLFLNNSLLEESQAHIPIDDRSFLFGDGIFETCKIFNGQIYDFESHLERINRGLKTLKFSAKTSDLEKKSLQLIKKNSIAEGLLKIEISRGSGSIGYSPHATKPLILIRTFTSRPLPKKIALGISTIKKPPLNSLPTDCKTKQSLPSILAKIEATENGLFDGIMLSQENFISETSSANIFWVKENKIYTPAKDCDMLSGTVKNRIIALSPTVIKEVKSKISDLKNAEEIFLTNSSFLVLPVDELVIGKQRKKLRKNLGEMFRELMQFDVEEQCPK